MRSKCLVRFYSEHCSRTISKIASCEKSLAELQQTLLAMYDRSHSMQLQLNTLWSETLGISIQQREIFSLKRREALLLSRHEELQLQIQETTEIMNELTERRDGFIKLRFYYEKKKMKWEWMLNRAKKMRIRQNINNDEKATEECISWSAL